MTTTLKVSSMPREFLFQGWRIPDPDPKMDVEQVRELLTPSYPEIATATMTGPEDRERSALYLLPRHRIEGLSHAREENDAPRGTGGGV